MATDLGKNQASFQGLDLAYARPGAVASVDDLTTIAEDQGYVYSQIRGLNSDGTAYTPGDGHKHTGSGDGHPLYHPLSTGEFYASNSAGVAVRGELRNPAIPGEAYRTCMFWPVFLNPGADSLVVYIRASTSFAFVYPILNVYNRTTNGAITSGNLVSTHELVDFGGNNNDYFFLVTGLTGNEYQLELTTSRRECSILSVCTYPKVPATTETNRRWAIVQRDPPIVNSEVSGYLRNALWKTVWDTYIQEDFAVQSHTLDILARNDGILFEILTGQPVPGYGSALLAPHDHVSPAANSELLSRSLVGRVHGCLPTSTEGGYTDGVESDFLYCPVSTGADGTITKDHDYGLMELPTPITSETVNCASIIYNYSTNAGTSGARWQHASDPSLSTDLQTSSVTGITNKGGYYYVKSTISAGLGGTRYFTAGVSKATGSDSVAQLGHTWWLT